MTTTVRGSGWHRLAKLPMNFWRLQMYFRDDNLEILHMEWENGMSRYTQAYFIIMLVTRPSGKVLVRQFTITMPRWVETLYWVIVDSKALDTPRLTTNIGIVNLIPICPTEPVCLISRVVPLLLNWASLDMRSGIYICTWGVKTEARKFRKSPRFDKSCLAVFVRFFNTNLVYSF